MLRNAHGSIVRPSCSQKAFCGKVFVCLCTICWLTLVDWGNLKRNGDNKLLLLVTKRNLNKSQCFSGSKIPSGIASMSMSRTHWWSFASCHLINLIYLYPFQDFFSLPWSIYPGVCILIELLVLCMTKKARSKEAVRLTRSKKETSAGKRKMSKQ